MQRVHLNSNALLHDNGSQVNAPGRVSLSAVHIYRLYAF